MRKFRILFTSWGFFSDFFPDEKKESIKKFRLNLIVVLIKSDLFMILKITKFFVLEIQEKKVEKRFFFQDDHFANEDLSKKRFFSEVFFATFLVFISSMRVFCAHWAIISPNTLIFLSQKLINRLNLLIQLFKSSG